MNIQKVDSLKRENYYRRKYPKNLIVLHHTCGSTAAGAINHWNQDSRHIATAYMIEKNGTILQFFDPRYWSFHLGLKGTAGALDKRSIGIELVNEGGLLPENTEKHCKVFDNNCLWRGFRYFAQYTKEQIDATAELVDFLCNRFDIPKKAPANHPAFDPGLCNFKGVVGHHQLRKDKSDLHPGFDWRKLVDDCQLRKIV